MIIFAFALAATPLTDIHQRDIACVVEIAVLADAQKRGVADGTDVQASGRRWAGIVGDRITFESGQPKQLVAIAMNEAATARASRPLDNAQVADCLRRMTSELAMADAADTPLPKPVRPQ